MAASDSPRRAAVAALVRVHGGGWANLVADSVFEGTRLDGRDRAFAGALFFGTAERITTLDYLLRPLLKKPVEKLDAEVRAILESGLYQLLYMRVPASAAVNESVKLARSFGKSSAAGLVNAVLRKGAALPRLADGAGPDWARFSFATEEERVCTEWSVSSAVARAVMAALPAEYDAFFAHSFHREEICLRANTLKTTAQQLAGALRAEGVAVREGRLPNALYAKLTGDVAENVLFRAGYFHVQGEASQYACACLSAAPGDHVLDLCAAPGGKSALLAQQMGGGAGLTACDIRAGRLELVAALFARLGITGGVLRRQDATAFDESLCGQDKVLCDVPCSGLGVLAAKPDLRLSNGEVFAALPALQLKILLAASRYVKRGGRLVYSTCTIRPEENEEVVQAFLRQNSEYTLEESAVPPEGGPAGGGMVTLLPHKGGYDGFFVATMRHL